MPLFRRFGRPGLLGAVTRTAVVAGTATMTARAVGRGQAARSRGNGEPEALEQHPLPTRSPAAEESVPSQLSTLNSLKEAGAIDADEYAKAKKQVLG